MGRNSNPRYAFDANTLSREAEKGDDPDVRSGFPSTDRAICRDQRLAMSALNGQQNGQQTWQGQDLSGGITTVETVLTAYVPPNVQG